VNNAWDPSFDRCVLVGDIVFKISYLNRPSGNREVQTTNNLVTENRMRVLAM